MDSIENRTYDEITIGDSVSLSHTLTMKDIELFAVMSGDVNPAHLDEEYARSSMFREIIAHGMWGGALISTLLGTQLPGPGAIYLGQTLRFRRPIGLGDTITVSVVVTAKDDAKHRITFDCQCTNQDGEVVITGSAEVLAPTEKIKRPRVILPDVHLHDRGVRYRQLIALTDRLDPIRVAVVHPVQGELLNGAIAAAEASLIIPVFVGPEARIRAAAELAEKDLTPYTIVATEHSHAAAAQAVALARSGRVDALMDGNLRTDEFLREMVSRDSGLRTGRRMSHIFVMDVPTYPRPLLLTDAALNVAPDLEAKRDIVQNAIDLALALGIAVPKVAILSSVETLNSKIRSTLDAAALCKMADRRQIHGGVVDGPLAFDSAVSDESARTKGVISPVAGQADILVVPDLESGSLLAKQLEYLAEAQTAGIIMGARTPIVLTGQTADTLSHVAACAIALLLVRRRVTG
ncbi:MAG: bifunctional enoyl-CoA hydratase/phosphate acetyltransferase [Chloroflexales bacterium]|nr:bifunctional enoyl-CoA hydratase/phosphate acetyltransferase [Chloroflexales bacterium]